MEYREEEDNNIAIFGAREHNLKNIDLTIPRDKLTVITGLSGSGKSSLAFDTIYAEGQRRYLETFSAYARRFLGGMERPDVDKITGLSPVISIEQKTTNKNPRSTVGTTTEIYDFLRLLYARAGVAYSYATGSKMVKYTDEQILELLQRDFAGRRILLLAPVVKGRKGHYRELFENLRKNGFISARVDGELREITIGMSVDRYKMHDIEIVVDKIVMDQVDLKRLKNSVATAMKHGKGVMTVKDYESDEIKYYSRHLMCPDTGLSYKDPAPHTFSFNSPHGACKKCKGLGFVNEVAMEKIIPDNSLSIHAGGILPLGKYKASLIFYQIETILKKHGADIKQPIRDLPEEALTDILYGYPGQFRLENAEIGVSSNFLTTYEGILKYVTMQEENSTSKKANKWAEQFISVTTCDVCNGQRLNQEALHFYINGKNISELANMELSDLYEWVSNVEEHLEDKQKQIAGEILKEIRTRLKFMLDVGLEYLSLNRQSMTLSGGESQRIRLATQIGSQLVNVLYILDEPSIGLHSRDTDRLIQVLHRLRDIGNTVVVVEHDEDIIKAADEIIDVGPLAGRLGGEIVYQGTLQNLKKADTLTADYIYGKKNIPVPAKRRKSNRYILLSGATENNLKNIDVKIPLGIMTAVTGVSGSGKSTLIKTILVPALKKYYGDYSDRTGSFNRLSGDVDFIHGVEFIDQNPIGKSSRSNPVTYLKAWDDIRKIFADEKLSKLNGFKPAHFSFNVPGGRCEECQGEGIIKVEMQFMADVYLECEHCKGKRFKDEVLEVKYKGLNIYDILEMTVNQAVEFFSSGTSHSERSIISKLQKLIDVGLGYIKLGQASSTLSGGESQRVKLAYHLSQENAEPTLFVFDEPTTGLHFHDIHKLMDSLNALIERGHTVLIIEHNMDVIKCADNIIDLGPEGGSEGGYLVFEGTPEELIKCETSYTGKYLAEKLQENK